MNNRSVARENSSPLPLTPSAEGPGPGPLRTALVGVSGFGAVHFDDLLRHAGMGNLRPCAAAVINQEEEREKCDRLLTAGARLYADFSQMISANANELDLVMIPTGIALHAPMTIAALDAGASVLVEKPLAGTCAEADAMLAARERAGRHVAVGFQYLYDPALHECKRAILDGSIGSLRSLKFCGLWPRTSGYYSRNDWAGRLRWRDRWIYDSPANNAFSHFLMLMLFLSGTEPDACAEVATLDAELYRANQIESFDTISMRLKTSSGAVLHFAASHAISHSEATRIEIEGSRGRVEWSPTLISMESSKGRQIWHPSTDTELRDHMIESVVQRIHGLPSFICDIETARNHTACIESLHRSHPIADIDPRFIVQDYAGEDGQTMRVVRDLDRELRNSVAAGKLLGEMGIPWATVHA